jgi:hypothetical protein
MSYREAPSQPRFVCLCCEAREPWPGLCPKCEVERLPLADARVREELATAGERRLHARAGREQRLLGIATFLLASPLAWLGGWPIGMVTWFAAAIAGTTVVWRIVARWRGSALYVFRRRQTSSLE